MSSSDLIADRRFLHEERAWHGIVCPWTQCRQRTTFRRTSLSAYSSITRVLLTLSNRHKAAVLTSQSESSTESFLVKNDVVRHARRRDLLFNKSSSSRQSACQQTFDQSTTSDGRLDVTRQQSRQVVSGPFRANQGVPARSWQLPAEGQLTLRYTYKQWRHAFLRCPVSRRRVFNVLRNGLRLFSMAAVGITVTPLKIKTRNWWMPFQRVCLR